MEIDNNTKNNSNTNSSMEESNKNQQKSEYEKMDEYMKKINNYRNNNYINCLEKDWYCDFYNDGWAVGLIASKEKNFLCVYDIYQYYIHNNKQILQIQYSKNIAYFRKHTKPSLENMIPSRPKKNFLENKIRDLLSPDKENIFTNKKEEKDPKVIFELYYFLHSSLYYSIDYSICKAKDKNSGVEEGFKIILIVLEYLAEFYNYINDNFDDFINYKSNIADSELSDLVLFDKKYAIFSFWEDANNLMNKIFIKNANYLVWFIESEKVLQKIMPSSPNMKKIGPKDKLICPLYEPQIDIFKLQNYNYTGKNGQIIKLKKICSSDAYQNTVDSQTKVHYYIKAYFIDYFFALGGYKALFSLCRENHNIKLTTSIFNNISYASSLTKYFKSYFEIERNGINTILFKFVDSIDAQTLNTFSKNDIFNFIKKGASLCPKISEKSSIIFEELYIRFKLKYLSFAKNDQKRLEAINDLVNILYSIEYCQLFNEKNYKMNFYDGKNLDEVINDQKFSNRYKNIKEVNYNTFCTNFKNSGIIETLFKEDSINEEILKEIAPILFNMYQNNFGIVHSELKKEEVKNTKTLVFNAILNKLKQAERENIKVLMEIEKIICEFCEVLTDEDKFYFFNEINIVFESSMVNQNISFKEIFNFVINFSSIGVKKTNSYDEDSKENNEKNMGKNMTKKVEEKSNKNLEDEEQMIEISNDKFDEKIYFGLELINRFLSFEQYDQLKLNDMQKLEFINAALEGIVKIISNINSPKIAINIILNKIYNSIVNKKDVLQHLFLLLKLLNYSIFNNFSAELNNFLPKYLKKYDLAMILIDELSSFLEQLKQNNISDSENNNQNEKDLYSNININLIEKNVYKMENGYLNENYNIKRRIQTIFNLLLKYKNSDINYDKIKNFFIMAIKFSENSKNILYYYLFKTINNFSIDLIKYLFENIISQKEIFVVNDLVTYRICKNFIIQMNKLNNSLFLMNNKDIGLILNKLDIEKEVLGINMLFDLLSNEEQNLDASVINDITDFICNIYFGVRFKIQTNIFKAYEDFWKNLIKNISDKLSTCIENKDKKTKSIKCLILLIKKIIDISNNRNGEIIKDISEIEKESKKYSKNNKNQAKEYSFFKMVNDSSICYDIKINGGDYFYILRYKLSSFFKIPVNQIKIIVHQNSLGKIKKITPQQYEKICKSSINKEFNYLKDFENIYDQLNGLAEWESKGKKKLPLLIEVKTIENPCKDILKFNPIEILYNKSNLSLTLMNLLKEGEAPYTFDVLCLVRGNQNDDSTVLIEEIKNIILGKNKNNDLFNFENTSIYYISYIISNLSKTIQSNLNPSFIESFLKSDIWNNNIKNLNIISDEYNFDSNQKLPLLGELFEKYNLVNNLANIYLAIADNLGLSDIDLIWFIVYKIIKIYNYIINESVNINLKKCGKTEGVTIDNVKDLYIESLTNINHLIVNNDKILKNVISSLVKNDNNNEYMMKIKNTFEYIIFDSILKNKLKAINKRIKSLVIDILNKLKNDKNNQFDNQSFYYLLIDFYLTENSFNKIINILQEIYHKNSNINNYRYENNVKILFDIITKVIFDIYEFVKEKFDINKYIENILLPKLYKVDIPNIPSFCIFNQLILGGVYKIFHTLLLISDTSFNALKEKNKKIIDYLFESIIMSKCNEKILTPQNIKNEENSLTISSEFCIKEASNLFILLLFNNDLYNIDTYNSYIQKLTSFHKLCFWKGSNLSDWRLYFKESQKSSPFVGLKNLGCTCYINSLIQIFYHIPLMRESLLKCKFPASKNNCFYQLKIIFYSLKYLQTSYYSPKSFMDNYDDQKLNVSVQMDAFEFFCDFLDKIEQKIANTKNENIIKYFFMGRQNDVLTFEEDCTHHRSNESQFYSIQLQVQGKKDIYESLDSLIEGEKMFGENRIFCPECNRKLPAIKSQNFKTLPRIFMFVLKRFEFNYQTMQKTKINDYYHFPLILDMNKYTEEYIKNKKDEDNKYKLKSIIIHSGNCDAGHYYAYILDEKSNEWYEFNDTKVEKININYFETEAYGKLNVISDDKGNQIEDENPRSAYMLFYEKINKDNCEKFENIDIINEILNINNNTNNIIDNQNKIEEEDDNDFNLLSDNKIDTNENSNKINNINEIEDNDKGKQDEEIENILIPINEEMFKYFLNKKLFSGEYHHFVLSLFLNLFNKIFYHDTKLSFPDLLCGNEYTNLPNEIKNYKKNRKNQELSNIDDYILTKKILLFDVNKVNNINEINDETSNNNELSKDEKEKILDLFKNLIIYFFNVMIRGRERDYLGGTINLIKYLINNYLFCADYLVEEFSNFNVLIEYLLNCPSYEAKKLVVGIIYCAMIKCVTLYEKKMRQEEATQKQLTQPQNQNSKKQSEKNKKSKNKQQQVQLQTQEEKGKDQSNSKEAQELSDEELARKLQDEFNNENGGDSNSYLNGKNDDFEINSNPLERKYIPQNVLKLIYNCLYIIKNLNLNNMNEARFFYFILYRFSQISKKTKKFLINKALVLELLNVHLLPEIMEEEHDRKSIYKSIEKGLYTSSHDILNTHKDKLNGIYDKGGAFHYENYTTMLYFYLLSHEQKEKPKHRYFEGSYTFDNKKFIRSLFFKINTKQDAYIFANLIIVKCKHPKNYKNRIDNIIYNIINILNRADNNERINYDVNSNKDNHNKGVYSGFEGYNNLDLENNFPRINPKYVLLIFKRFIVSNCDNKKIDEYRINTSLKYFFKLIIKSDNVIYYNYMIMMIDFITELFTNYFNIMNPYIKENSQYLKEIIEWIRAHSISPELYPIEGIKMYKDDNVAYRNNITENEKIQFNAKQSDKSDKKIHKIINILEGTVNGKDYEYEADFDLTDFNFRKGDHILYDNKKAIVKEHIDELISVKIIDKNNDNKKDNKSNDNNDEEKNSISEIEKIKFWVAKDNKNISIFNLE